MLKIWKRDGDPARKLDFFWGALMEAGRAEERRKPQSHGKTPAPLCDWSLAGRRRVTRQGLPA